MMLLAVLSTLLPLAIAIPCNTATTSSSSSSTTHHTTSSSTSSHHTTSSSTSTHHTTTSPAHPAFITIPFPTSTTIVVPFPNNVYMTIDGPITFPFPAGGAQAEQWKTFTSVWGQETKYLATHSFTRKGEAAPNPTVVAELESIVEAVIAEVANATVS